MDSLESKAEKPISNVLEENNYQTLERLDLTDIGRAIGGGPSKPMLNASSDKKTKTKRDKLFGISWLW